jgi:hypothetical protein
MRFAAPLALLLALTSLFATTSFAQTNTTQPKSITAPSDLSRGTSDIIKLFAAGKKDSALIFYAKFSGLEFRPTAKHITYLQAIGISPEVITAMLASDKERQSAVVIQRDIEPTYVATAASTATASSASPPAVRKNEQQYQPTIVYPDYSAYPNYYGAFVSPEENKSRRPVISIVIGVGVGFGDGYYHGYRGYGGYHIGRH